MPNEKRGAVAIRQKKQKELLIEELGKRPIVQAACQKAGIGRASYYRWRKEDPAFTAKVDEAIETGTGIVNDMAETQLMAAIRDGNMTAVVFWLKHHHRSYATRVEISMPERKAAIDLTEEQKAAIRESLEVFSANPGDEAAKSGAIAPPKDEPYAHTPPEPETNG